MALKPNTFGQRAACALSMSLLLIGAAGLSHGQSLEPTGEGTAALIEQMRAAHTGEFASRTVNFGPDGTTPRYLNRLVLEDSPYLRQHAHNPVDWHPWTPETLQHARDVNKPIFLSIGYATCHWCHVMEHESFDNEEVAEVINEHFIAVKVDREENPDVDLLYMTALQLQGNGAGWPLTAFLMPNTKPFYLDTYLRPNDLQHVMGQVDTYWTNDRFELVLFSESIGNRLKRYMQASRGAAVANQSTIEEAAGVMMQTVDRNNGGFGSRPKFPHEPELIWLLDMLDAGPNEEITNAVRLSLRKMQEGGIHDQIGGGFHRYATDAAWTIPHFEKMLYNQAQLIEAYARGAAAFDDASFERTADRIAAFVFRDMTHADGLHTSGYDADSEGREGPFYLWDEPQLEQILTPEEFAWATAALGVDDRYPNFEGHSLPTYRTNQPFRDDVLDKLEKARRERIWPLLDDKRITAWNAQMIEAFAVAGEVMDRPEWITHALSSGERLWQLHADPDAFTLLRFSTDKGVSATEGVLPDYAYAVKAFVRLFDASGDRKWLERAEGLALTMQAQFWDDDLRLYAEAPADDTDLFMRPVSTNDGAQFSSASTAVLGLIELGRRLEDPTLEMLAANGIPELASRASDSPTAHSSLWRATQRRLRPGLSVGGVAVSAAGTVRAKLDKGALTLAIAPGWHINSVDPALDYLIGTQVRLAGQSGDIVANWPEPKLTELGFSDQPLTTYEGRLTLDLQDLPGNGAQNRLSIRVQACDDERCLPPETLSLPVPRL